MQEEALAWRVLVGLRPAPALAGYLAAYKRHVGNNSYNFLHLRVEEDWKAHCARCAWGTLWGTGLGCWGLLGCG